MSAPLNRQCDCEVTSRRLSFHKKGKTSLQTYDMVAKQLLACCALFVVYASRAACDDNNEHDEKAALDESFLEDPDLVFSKSYTLVRTSALQNLHTIPHVPLLGCSCLLAKPVASCNTNPDGCRWPHRTATGSTRTSYWSARCRLLLCK